MREEERRALHLPFCFDRYQHFGRSGKISLIESAKRMANKSNVRRKASGVRCIKLTSFLEYWNDGMLED